MELISESIKCTSCKQVLKMPVLLPCGHCICRQHVTEAVEKSMTRQIECAICSEFFDIHENGFPRNRSLESLLEKNIEKLDLGEEYNSAVDKCNLFSDLLDDFNRIRNDPGMRIHSVISDLKNKIDLRREELKNEIDQEALKMIEKLDEYEKECKDSIELDDINKMEENLENYR